MLPVEVRFHESQRRPDLLALQALRRPLPRRVVLPRAVGRDRLPDAVARRPAGHRLERTGSAWEFSSASVRLSPGGVPTTSPRSPAAGSARTGVVLGFHVVATILLALLVLGTGSLAGVSGGRPAVLRARGRDRVGLLRLLLPGARDRADLRPQPDRVRLRHGDAAPRDHPARRATGDGGGVSPCVVSVVGIVLASSGLRHIFTDRAGRCARAPVRARCDGAARRLRARRLGEGRRARLARAGLPRPALLHRLRLRRD